MRLLVLFCMLFLLLITSGLAHEVRIGLLVHDVAPLFGANKVEGGFDLNGEFIFGKGIVRPLCGVAINSQGETSRVYTGLVFDVVHSRSFVSLGLGGAVQVNSVRDLGSTLLFRLSCEVGYMWGKHGVSILFDHISNANLASSNAGLDTLGVRYGYRF